MENKNKKRILIGILIVLILMNLATLGTFGFKKYFGHTRTEKRWDNSKKDDKKPEDRVKEFVKRTLKLDKEQFKKYSDLKDVNIKNSTAIWEDIARFRRAINMEITKENPDTIWLLQCADSTGYYHKKMQIEMNRHFMAVQKILDKSQLERYNIMIQNIDNREWAKHRKKGQGNDTSNFENLNKEKNRD